MRKPSPGLVFTTVATFFAPLAAMGDDVVVVKPGIACKSSAALAKLTRPDGSSRSEGTTASPESVQVARDGGCTRLRVGQKFIATSIRKNTSIVLADGTSSSQRQTLIVPNIDLSINAIDHADLASSSVPAQEAKSEQQPALPARGTQLSNYFSTDGIALGEKGPAVVNLLQARGFRIEQFPSSSLNVSVVKAEKKDDAGIQSYSIDLLEGNVMFIDREEIFADGHQPLIETIRSAVKAKYGANASMDLADPRPKHDVNMTWSYSPQGALAKNEDLCDSAEHAFNAADFANVKDATGTNSSVFYWLPHLAPPRLRSPHTAIRCSER